MSYNIWFTEPYLILDTETTGTTNKDRVVQLGLSLFDQGKLIRTHSAMFWPGIEIPEEATAIHGITTVQASSCPLWASCITDIIRLSKGANVGAYHADFDKEMIHREMSRVPMDLSMFPVFQQDHRWIDPLVWVRHLDRFVKGQGRHKLAATCARRGIPLLNAHEAVADSTAAGFLLWDMRHDIGEMTVSELLRQQTLLADAQERQFQAWKAREHSVGR